MLDLLSDEFGELAELLIENCKQQDIIMVPHEKLRHPITQATYWKTGKDEEKILSTMKTLKIENCDFLGFCLESAEQTNISKIITNALPGCSWHQWGEAMDCYWSCNGRKIWDLNYLDENGRNGYKIFAEEAKKLGLEAGYFWNELIDACHVQLRGEPSPLSFYSLKKINDLMAEYYS